MKRIYYECETETGAYICVAAPGPLDNDRIAQALPVSWLASYGAVVSAHSIDGRTAEHTYDEILYLRG